MNRFSILEEMFDGMDDPNDVRYISPFTTANIYLNLIEGTGMDIDMAKKVMITYRMDGGVVLESRVKKLIPIKEYPELWI